MHWEGLEGFVRKCYAGLRTIKRDCGIRNRWSYFTKRIVYKALLGRVIRV